VKEIAEAWSVTVDRARCMGTGACAHARPDVFGIGEDGMATVIGPVDGADGLLRDVVAECPTEALRLLRGGT
jgi:ferredoxin